LHDSECPGALRAAAAKLVNTDSVSARRPILRVCRPRSLPGNEELINSQLPVIKLLDLDQLLGVLVSGKAP
jgi:hypothetical protein